MPYTDKNIRKLIILNLLNGVQNELASSASLEVSSQFSFSSLKILICNHIFQELFLLYRFHLLLHLDRPDMPLIKLYLTNQG